MSQFYREMLKVVKTPNSVLFLLLQVPKSTGIINPRPFPQNFRCSKKKFIYTGLNPSFPQLSEVLLVYILCGNPFSGVSVLLWPKPRIPVPWPHCSFPTGSPLGQPPRSQPPLQVSSGVECCQATPHNTKPHLPLVFWSSCLPFSCWNFSSFAETQTHLPPR